MAKDPDRWCLNSGEGTQEWTDEWMDEYVMDECMNGSIKAHIART